MSAFSVAPATGEIEDGKAVLLTVTFAPRGLVTQTAVLEVRQLPLGQVHNFLETFSRQLEATYTRNALRRSDWVMQCAHLPSHLLLCRAYHI
jgi:hypothetical protein